MGLSRRQRVSLARPSRRRERAQACTAAAADRTVAGPARYPSVSSDPSRIRDAASAPARPSWAIGFALGTALTLALAGSGLHAETVETLADGRRITVIQVIEVEPEAGERTLILEYRTALDLADRVALQAEVDAVWQSFRDTVEAAGVTTAAIKAMAPPTGFLRKRSRAQETFVYWRRDGGAWLRR